MPRPDAIEYGMHILRDVAERSTCRRRKVGCILATDKTHILSTGYNGVPSGVTHCIDTPCPGAEDKSGDTSRCEAIHAEQNAVATCHRLDLATQAFVTCIPCYHCAKLLCALPNLRQVIVALDYADKRGVDLLGRRGVKVRLYDPSGVVGRYRLVDLN